jgi:hypothetical protein
VGIDASVEDLRCGDTSVGRLLSGAAAAATTLLFGFDAASKITGVGVGGMAGD